MKNKFILFFRTAFLALIAAVLLYSTLSSADAATSKLQDILIHSCEEGTTVDLYAYSVTHDELEDIFFDLYHSGKLPWYAEGSFSTKYNTESGFVVSFTPTLLDAQTYNRVLYERKVAEILAATILPGMEDWQKALAVHDYLIARSTYDETMTYTTGYDLLIRGTAVCSGYAEAYMDLMNRAGVNCVYVVSEEMEHAWNLIRIAGSWYHADLTWDDPTPNNEGTVSHKYFLISDAQIASDDQGGHYGWETDITCTSEVLNGTFWQLTESQVCYQNNRNSFFRSEAEDGDVIYNRGEFTALLSPLHTLPVKYIDIGYGSYAYPTEGLSMWNNRLYFADCDTVYSQALDGTDLVVEYKYDTAANKKFILGSFVENDILHLTLSDHDFQLTEAEIPLPASDYHKHSYIAQITPATCVKDGYTLYQCDCGISFQTDTVRSSGAHTYETTVLTEASPFREGAIRYNCTGCEHTYIEDTPKISFFKWIFDWIKSWFS